MNFSKRKLKLLKFQNNNFIKLLTLFFFTLLITFGLVLINALPINLPALQSKLDEPIKWVDFRVPYSALEKAMYLDIESYETETHLSWTEILAYLGAKYGGNFKHYKSKDMDMIADKLRSGESIEELTIDMKYYDYYNKAYTAVLGGFLGEFKIQVPIENDEGEYDGNIMWVEKYGLKAFSPIASGYWYNHYDDFGAGRSYGYNRKHFGHDLMVSTGTPIIAVESGIIEAMGWNQYGGWRIGIRSFDKQRYYYYAHLKKDRPYHTDLYVGKAVNAGDVIGYSGQTGYSIKENVNNIDTPHLHYGMQLIFDESLKDSPNQIWIDLYSITKLLSKNKCQVFKKEETKEYYRKFDISEPNFFLEESVNSIGPEGSISLPIIMYHGLVKDPSYQNQFFISPKTFEKDLKYLKENSYTPIFMKELISYVDHGTPLPENPIVLTFDDGYYNNYLYAYPLLREYDMKAVISIIGKYTDKYSILNENNGIYSNITWHQINEMLESNHIEIQNHSYNMHVNEFKRRGVLQNAYESHDEYILALQDDIGYLQNRIIEMTGEKPNTFSYPFGFFSNSSEDILKSMGFRATLSCAEGINYITRDPECLFHLKRILRSPDISSSAFFKSIIPTHTSP